MWWCLCVQVLGVEGEKNFRSQLELPNLSFCHNHKNSTLMVQSGKTFKLLVIFYLFIYLFKERNHLRRPLQKKYSYQ